MAYLALNSNCIEHDFCRVISVSTLLHLVQFSRLHWLHMASFCIHWRLTASSFIQSPAWWVIKKRATAWFYKWNFIIYFNRKINWDRQIHLNKPKKLIPRKWARNNSDHKKNLNNWKFTIILHRTVTMIPQTSSNHIRWMMIQSRVFLFISWKFIAIQISSNHDLIGQQTKRPYCRK